MKPRGKMPVPHPNGHLLPLESSEEASTAIDDAALAIGRLRFLILTPIQRERLTIILREIERLAKE